MQRKHPEPSRSLTDADPRDWLSDAACVDSEFGDDVYVDKSERWEPKYVARATTPLASSEPVAALPESALKLAAECDRIKAMLVEKNLAYGNSALDPVRVMSKADPVEQLLVRIDDKLSRIQRGHEYPGDDTITDLIGYLVLLKIALKERK